MKGLFTILFVFYAFFGKAQEFPSILDSLKSNADSVGSSFMSGKDRTLNAAREQEEKLRTINSNLTSFQQRIRFKIDSVRATPKPDTLLLTKLNQLESKTDSLKGVATKVTSNINGAIINEEMNKVERSVDLITGKIQNPVNEKISLFQRNGAEGLQGISLPNLSVHQLPIETPSLNSLELPDNNTGLEQTVSIPSMQFPEINQNGLSNLPGINDPTINNVGSLSEPLGNPANEITGKLPVDELQQLNNISPERIENEIEEIELLDGVSEQLSEVDRLKRYYDEDVAKEEVMNRAKIEATNHFAGHEEEVKAAMEELSKAKSKVPNTEDIVDLFAKNQNSLKEKTFFEKLVPGFTMQIQSHQSLWLDLNPSIGYKVTNRILAGTGWNERIAYYSREGKWDSDAHVYGVRSFIHYRLRDNFWLKGDIETMNINPQELRSFAKDIPGRMWVWSYLFGMKRDFRFAKNVSGNVQMLYNLWSTDRQNPYLQKINVRMGIEVSIFRKREDVKKCVE